jgi:hypothetical protein
LLTKAARQENRSINIEDREITRNQNVASRNQKKTVIKRAKEDFKERKSAIKVVATQRKNR